MKLKTINGHYDLVFSLAHNNRDFIPNNVDVSRTPWNYNCIVAGGSVYMDIDDPRFIPDFWERYRENSEIYWLDRAPAKQLEYERFQRELQWIRRHRMQWRKESHGLYGLFLTLPMLPLIIVDEVYWDKRYADAVTQRKAFKWEQSLQADNFKMQKSSFREALRAYDLRKGTKLLYYMDDLATEMAAYAGDIVNASEKHQPLLRGNLALLRLKRFMPNCMNRLFGDFRTNSDPAGDLKELTWNIYGKVNTRKQQRTNSTTTAETEKWRRPLKLFWNRRYGEHRLCAGVCRRETV